MSPSGSQTARNMTHHGPGAEEMRLLQELVASDSKFQLACLVSKCNPVEMAEMSDALICAYGLVPQGTERLLAWATTRHVRECGEQPETLFRGTSLETKIISTYIHKRCAEFVRLSVSPLLNFLLQNSAQSFEVDPSKEPLEERRLAAQKSLLDAAQLVMSNVVANTPRIPEEVCGVLRSIQSIVQEKFPDMGLRSVGSLLFLRLLCPCMVSPDTFLGFRQGTPQMRRSLILVSKLVQNMANLVQFGDKESYLLFANKWLQQAEQVYQKFIFDVVQGVRVVPQSARQHLASTAEQDLALRWLRNFFCVNRRVIQEKHAAELSSQETDARKQSAALLLQLRNATGNWKPVTQPDMPAGWRDALGLDKSALARSVSTMRQNMESVVKRASTSSVAAAPPPVKREDSFVIGAPTQVVERKWGGKSDNQAMDLLLEQAGAGKRSASAEEEIQGLPKVSRKNSALADRMKLSRKSVLGPVMSVVEPTGRQSSSSELRRRQRQEEDENSSVALMPMELSTPVNLSPLKKAKQRQSIGDLPTFDTTPIKK